MRFYSNENQRVRHQQTRATRSTSHHTRSSQKWATLLEEAPPILDDDDEQDENQKPAKEMPLSRRCGGRKTASMQPISKPKETEVGLKVQKQVLYDVNPKQKAKKTKT